MACEELMQHAAGSSPAAIHDRVQAAIRDGFPANKDKKINAQ
jgi:hypothetical protein